MKKIVEALLDLPANQHSQSSIMAGLTVLVSWQILKGSLNFLYTFTMALFHKWGVKTGFTFALQFFMLISDGLGGVNFMNFFQNPIHTGFAMANPQDFNATAPSRFISMQNFHAFLLCSSQPSRTMQQRLKTSQCTEVRRAFLIHFQK